MKKTTQIILIVAVVSVIIGYSLYYYVYKNLNWNLVGFGLSEDDFYTDQEGGETKKSIVDKLNARINIQNNSGLPFNLSRFKVKVVDGNGNQVGSIQPIRSIHVPAKTLQEIRIQVDNINEMSLLSDTMTGQVQNYRFVVSGWLGGFLPFRYTDYIL